MAVTESVQAGFLDARVANQPPAVRWYLANERSILGVGGLVGSFALWEIGADLGLFNTTFFSSPSRIIAVAITKLGDPGFWTMVRYSVIELGVGFAIGAVLGIGLGLLAGWYRRLQLFIDPWLSFFYALPRIALLPIVVLWLGLTVQSSVAAVFLGVFFTVVINTVHGVRTIDRRLLEVASSFRASRRRLFASVVLPGTTPYILAGLRLGVGHGLTGVFLGELFTGIQGLGRFIDNAGDLFEANALLFGVLIFTFIGVAMMEAIRLVENRVQQWRPRAAGQ